MTSRPVPDRTALGHGAGRAPVPGPAVTLAPVGPATPPEPAVAARHLHLWCLPDGTGLHAPWGAIASDTDGLLCCHLCGRWFRSLGSHVRVHGHTAASYRADMGLCRREALTASALSASISVRQRARYSKDATVRAWFADGQRRARSGELGRIAGGARHDRGSGAEQARREAALATGRETSARRQRAQLASVVEAAGRRDLADLLRTRYAAGASLAALARETGLGRARLREEMAAAGLRPRAPGSTTAAGRASRAHTADELAASRLGTDDLSGWLGSRRADGWTLAELGDAVGHSGHWVRSRLAGRAAGSGTRR